MHLNRKPKEHDGEDDMYDSTGFLTSEETANIPESFLDASVGSHTDAASSNNASGQPTPQIKREAENGSSLNQERWMMRGPALPAHQQIAPQHPAAPQMAFAQPSNSHSLWPPPNHPASAGAPTHTYSHSPSPHPQAGPPPYNVPYTNPNPQYPTAPYPIFRPPHTSNHPSFSNPPPSFATSPPAAPQHTSDPTAAPTVMTASAATPSQSQANAGASPMPSKPQLNPASNAEQLNQQDPQILPAEEPRAPPPVSGSTAPQDTATPSSTPKSTGRYSKDDSDRMEMGFDEMDQIIGKIAADIGVAPKLVYARYIARSSHRSRGGNSWNSYEKYIKIEKYLLLEMGRLDDHETLKYDFDTHPPATPEQVKEAWARFKDHHGTEQADELFEETEEQGTTTTKGARRREFDNLVKALASLGRQARNRSLFHVFAVAVGEMIQEDQSLCYIFEEGECEGFIKNKLNMTRDRLLGRIRNHVFDSTDEGLRIDEIIAAAESYGLTVTGAPVEKLRTSKNDCRTVLIDCAAECGIQFKGNRFPAKNMKPDFLKAGIAIQNWPPGVMLPWESDIGKKGILALPKDQQALVVDYCLRTDECQLRFLKVDPNELALGRAAILTYAPDKQGEMKKVFEDTKEKESGSKPTNEKPSPSKKATKPRMKKEVDDIVLPAATTETAPSTPTTTTTRNTRSKSQANKVQRSKYKSAEFVEDEVDELSEDSNNNDGHDLYGPSDAEATPTLQSGTKRKAAVKSQDQKANQPSKKARPAPATLPHSNRGDPTQDQRRVHFNGEEHSAAQLNMAPASISAAEFEQGDFTTMFTQRPASDAKSKATTSKAGVSTPSTPSASTRLANVPTPSKNAKVATPTRAPKPPIPPMVPTAPPAQALWNATHAPRAMQPATSIPPTVPTAPPAQALWNATHAPQAIQPANPPAQPPFLNAGPAPQAMQPPPWMMVQMMQQMMQQMPPEQQWQYMAQMAPQMPMGFSGYGAQGAQGNAWGHHPDQPKGEDQ
ncbi:hypothetical protein PM082_002179 [Marasmius tenuissimus]|nr:hypothetical protein PM082_002179 [Marasmius tenuissimus]